MQREPGRSVNDVARHQPTEIIRLTGITDDLMAGLSIDMAALQALIKNRLTC